MKEISKIEQEMNDTRKRKKIAEDCKKVRESIKQNSKKRSSRYSLRNENKNSNELFINTKRPTDHRNNNRSPYNLKNHNYFNRPCTAIEINNKPKWALTAQQYNTLGNNKPENVEEFMDNLDFDNFLQNIENPVINTDLSQNEISYEDEINSLKTENCDVESSENEISVNNNNSGNINEVNYDTRNSNIQQPINHKKLGNPKEPENNCINNDFTNSNILAKYILNQNLKLSRVHSKKSIAKIIEKRIRPKSCFAN